MQASGRTHTKHLHKAGKPAFSTVPDHLDILADLSSGTQAHMVFSSIMGEGMQARRVRDALPQEITGRSAGTMDSSVPHEGMRSSVRPALPGVHLQEGCQWLVLPGSDQGLPSA